MSSCTINRGSYPGPVMHVVLSDRPTEEQQGQILELFLGGVSIRRIPNMLNFDVSFEAVEGTIRNAIRGLIAQLQTED